MFILYIEHDVMYLDFISVLPWDLEISKQMARGMIFSFFSEMIAFALRVEMVEMVT